MGSIAYGYSNAGLLSRRTKHDGHAEPQLRPLLDRAPTYRAAHKRSAKLLSLDDVEASTNLSVKGNSRWEKVIVCVLLSGVGWEHGDNRVGE